MYMFMKRYRTSHEIMEPKARTINMLGIVSHETNQEAMSTYRVVKFIVTVRLVENRLKRTVGRVMEVKVTSQYRNVGMKRPRSKSKAPNIPNHDRDVPCCELAKAEIWGSEEVEAEALRVEGGVEAFRWRIESMTEDEVGGSLLLRHRTKSWGAHAAFAFESHRRGQDGCLFEKSVRGIPAYHVVLLLHV